MEAYLEVETLVLVAMGGVVVIWLVLYWTGSFKSVLISSASEVVDHLRKDAPLFRQSDAIISADRKAAMAVNTKGDLIALVFVMGDKLVTKLLDGNEQVQPMLVGGRDDKPLSLHLKIDDFAVPKVDIALGTCKEGDSVLRWVAEHPGSDQATGDESVAKDVGNLWIGRIKALNPGTGVTVDIKGGSH